MLFVTCGVFVALALVILIGGALMFVNRASSRVAGELARIREAGEPASVIKLEEHYRLPPGVEDTTELWLDATRRLGREAFAADAGELPIVGLAATEAPRPHKLWDDLDAAERLLHKYREPLHTMHEAADLGGAARYPVDFKFRSLVLYDHTERLLNGARLLALEAHVRAHHWDPRGAAESIRTIFVLARSMEREPTSTSLSMRLMVDATARDEIRALLPTADFSDMDLAWFQDNLRAIDYHDGLHQAVLGERAMGIDAFQHPDSMELEVRVSGLWRFTQSSGFAFYLRHANWLAVAAKRPWPQALQAAVQADAELAELIVDPPPLTKATHVFPVHVGLDLVLVFNQTGHNVAMNGAADAAIAVELYRRRHGELPERLDELVPDFLPRVPIDPFDGQPLRYAVSEEEYVLYSVGFYRVDNGWDPSRQFGNITPYIVFRVLRSP
ncbi:MAG: hypothetical protein HQ582_32535 [Planctomycetes bacterium]|nr:hypothetical protein [Planctomycetota bacterium]